MAKGNAADNYLEWLMDLVCIDRRNNQFTELLTCLHDIRFEWVLTRDRNRALDGIDLRRRFSLYCGYDEDYLSEYVNGPCSVLEMMIGLSVRCEECIMDDPRYGDRTGQWFWMMIKNLGLGGMTNRNFDIRYVDDVIETFLARKYEPDGTGNIFRIKYIEEDLRDVEIWVQMCWYLDSLNGN